MSEQARHLWEPELNGRVAVTDVGRCSEIQFFFWLDCEQHLTYTSPKCIRDKEKQAQQSGLACRQCHHAMGLRLQRFVSKHEVTAWQVLQSCFTDARLVEIKVLGERWGATDIWLPWCKDRQQRLDLIIMIDGEGHIRKKTYNITVAQQKKIDKDFNDECWRQDHRLLRLHMDDKEAWRNHIVDALQRYDCQPDMKFRRFSNCYPADDDHELMEAPMNGRHVRQTGAYFEDQ